MKGLLEGHLAVVTGGASGIGQAIAKGFAGQGAEIVVLDANAEVAEIVCRDIREAGGTAQAFGLDVRDRARCAEVADRVGKVWGLGSGIKGDPGPWVGELRNMWKPTAQPNLWFHGGNLMQSRHYSLYLALQLKARMEGIPTPVYYVDPVHHLN